MKIMLDNKRMVVYVGCCDHRMKYGNVINISFTCLSSVEFRSALAFQFPHLNMDQTSPSISLVKLQIPTFKTLQ